MKCCPKCENKLIEGLKYCFNCGADVDTKKATEIVNEDVNNNVNSEHKNKVKTRLSVEVFDVFFE